MPHSHYLVHTSVLVSPMSIYTLWHNYLTPPIPLLSLWLKGIQEEMEAKDGILAER